MVPVVPTGISSTTIEGLWSISLSFIEVSETAAFDYVEMLHRNKSGAGPPQETRFALAECKLHNPADKTLGWAVPVYRHLTDACGRLEAAEADIVVWAESGFDMRVTCGKTRIGHMYSDLDNKRLREFVAQGISLDALKGRMVCKVCGAREARLRAI